MASSPASKTRRFSPKFLLNPYWIAVLASVGVHGLFFAFGPRFSDVSFAAWEDGDAASTDEPRNVPLVQLTPAEQSRLPNFSPTPFSLEPNRLSNPPSSFKPPSASTLPTPNAFGSFPNTPPPGLQQAPSTFSPQRPPTLRAPFRAPPAITQFRLPVRESPQVIRPPSGIRPGVIPDPPGQPQTEPNSETPNSDSAANPSESSSGSLPELPSSDPQILDERLRQAESAGEDSPTAPADALAGTEGASAPAQNSDELSSEPSLTAAAPGEGESGVESGPGSSSLLEAYQYDATGTSEGEVSAATEEWLSAAQEKVGAADLQSGEADLSLDANVLKVCLDQPPTDGLVGVLVDLEGRPQEVSLLRSTGYDILNSQALTAVRNYNFPQSDGSVPYQVKIIVDYEAEGCVNQLPETPE